MKKQLFITLTLGLLIPGVAGAMKKTNKQTNIKKTDKQKRVNPKSFQTKKNDDKFKGLKGFQQKLHNQGLNKKKLNYSKPIVKPKSFKKELCKQMLDNQKLNYSEPIVITKSFEEFKKFQKELDKQKPNYDDNYSVPFL